MNVLKENMSKTITESRCTEKGFMDGKSHQQDNTYDVYAVHTEVKYSYLKKNY